MQDESFIPRDYQKPILEFSDILETMQTKIKIRIHRAVMDRVLDYCAYEELAPDGDEYYIVDFPFIENDYYFDILLSFGNKCECLEPLYIRTEMKRRIHDIAVLYENQNMDIFMAEKNCKSNKPLSLCNNTLDDFGHVMKMSQCTSTLTHF